MTSHLYPVLGQLRLHGEHLARVHVGVVRLVEGLLQLLQLVRREHRPAETEPEPVTSTSDLNHLPPTKF